MLHTQILKRLFCQANMHGIIHRAGSWISCPRKIDTVAKSFHNSCARYKVGKCMTTYHQSVSIERQVMSILKRRKVNLRSKKGKRCLSGTAECFFSFSFIRYESFVAKKKNSQKKAHFRLRGSMHLRLHARFKDLRKFQILEFRTWDISCSIS